MTSTSPAPTASSPQVDREANGENGENMPHVGEDGKPFRLSGSLFFALPDGGAVLYRLEGVAADPEVN